VIADCNKEFKAFIRHCWKHDRQKLFNEDFSRSAILYDNTKISDLIDHVSRVTAMGVKPTHLNLRWSQAEQMLPYLNIWSNLKPETIGVKKGEIFICFGNIGILLGLRIKVYKDIKHECTLY
jgi:hypothetical protein